MNIQYEDQFIRINNYQLDNCIEIVGKTTCDDYSALKRLLKIINMHIEKSQATKIILSVEKFTSLSYSNIITKEFLPSIAKLGVHNIAIITGDDENVKVFFDEYDRSLLPIKQTYSIETKHFKSLNEGLSWIAQK